MSGYISAWADNFTSEVLKNGARIPNEANCKLAASAIWQVDISNIVKVGTFFVVQ